MALDKHVDEIGLNAEAIHALWALHGLGALKEALRRVGVETLPSRLEQSYNAGQTTQVPTGRVVGVTRRVRRKIGYGGVSLSFERAGPAPR